MPSPGRSPVPSDRPVNWIGTNKRYALVDPAITSQALCDSVCQELADRITKTHEMIEINCDLMLADDTSRPLWKGDPFKVYGEGIYRIEELGCDFHREPTGETWHWRDATYTARKIADEA